MKMKQCLKAFKNQYGTFKVPKHAKSMKKQHYNIPKGIARVKGRTHQSGGH